MDSEQNSSDSLRLNEYKLSKKQRRVVQKQLKLRKALARHENTICSDIATKVRVILGVDMGACLNGPTKHHTVQHRTQKY